MNVKRTNDKLRAAVIGTGRIGEQHLRYLQESEWASAVAVCDLSLVQAQFMSDGFSGGQPYTDFREMLKIEQPDVVHVLTPPHTHVFIATECLNSGAHVIVEKPIAPTREDLRTLWGFAQERNLIITEDHNYRFNEPVRQLENVVAQGTIGDLREVEVRMSLGIRDGGRYADRNLPHPSHGMPAGVVHEFLPHLVYLALNFFPQGTTSRDYDAVSALWTNRGGGDLFKYDDLEASFDRDLMRGRIRFSCHGKPDEFTVKVTGTKGSATADIFQPHVSLNIPRKGPQVLAPLVNQWEQGKSLKKAAWNNFWAKVLGKSPYEGLSTFLEQTYCAIRSQSKLPVSLHEMDETLHLIEVLLEDAETPARAAELSNA